MSISRVLWLAKKELLHLRRDPLSFRILFILPIIQLILVGYAARLDVTELATAICDEDRTAASIALARRIDGSPYFACIPAPPDHRAVQALLDTRRVRVAIIVPRGYQRAIAAGRPAQIAVCLDGTDTTTARIAAAYIEGLLADINASIVLRWLRRRPGLGKPPAIHLRPTILYNPRLASRDYMVPGVVGLVILVLLLSLSTVAIVRERELGTLERLLMAPLSPWEFIAGKLLPFLAIGMIDAAVVLALAHFWFHIPIRGSVAFLYACIVLFALNTLGVGLMTSSIARTQQQAILTSIFIILPSILLSGFVAPIPNMPRWLQAITYAIPLRYFLVIVRGVCLKGLGPADVWPEIAALATLTFAAIAVGAAAIRRRALSA